MKKKILVVALAVLMLLALTACEGENAFIGHWRIIEISAGDITMTEEDMSDMGLDAGFVKLQKSRNAVVNLLGDEYDGKWELSKDEESATVTYGDDMKGTLTKTEDGLTFVDAQGSTYQLARF